MAKAAAVTETGMTAVLGGVEDEVLAAHRQARPDRPPTSTAPARSSPAARWSSWPPSRTTPPARARLIPLSVAGAFHTVHMAPAVDHLREAAAGHHARRPAGQAAVQRRRRRSSTDGAEFMRRLVDQVSSPVRWDACMATMADLGVTAMIELLPGGTLTGLAKRGAARACGPWRSRPQMTSTPPGS